MSRREFSASKRYTIYVLILLSAASMFNYMDRFVLSVLVQPIKEDLGLSDTQMGLLTGFAFALFYATFGLPLARLADRKSRVVVLSTCMAVWSTMTASCGAAGNFMQLLLARVGVGVGEAGCVPSSHSLLADYYPPEKRAFALGVFQAAAGIGLLVGLVTAGMLADTIGWRWTFVIIGAPGVLLAVLTLLTVREPPRGRMELASGRKHSDAAPSFMVACKTLFSRRSYRQILIAYALGLFGVYGVLQWVPAFLIRSHGLSLTQIGLGFGLAAGIGTFVGTGLGGVLASPLIARDRRWEVLWPGIAYGVSVPIYVAAFLVPQIGVAVGLMFLGTLIASSGIGPGMASVQTVAEPRLRGTAIALVMFASAIIGQGGGPFVIGVLSDLWEPQFGVHSLRYALIASQALMLWSVVHFFLAARTLRDDAVN